MKITTLLASILFFQCVHGQTNPTTKMYHEVNSAVTSRHGNLENALPDYLAQARPTVRLQGEGATVPPQEGKTETENVWINRGLWIALIAILIILYIRRRKKQ